MNNKLKVKLTTIIVSILVIFTIVLGAIVIYQNQKYKKEITSLEKQLSYQEEEKEEETIEYVSEYQTLSGAGLEIELNPNYVKLRIDKDELGKYLNKEINFELKDYDITGLDEGVSSIFLANNGKDFSPIVFFIMKDGSLEYLIPLPQLEQNKDELKIDGKINCDDKIKSLKTDENNVVIATTSSGDEFKIWNNEE